MISLTQYIRTLVPHEGCDETDSHLFYGISSHHLADVYKKKYDISRKFLHTLQNEIITYL